MLYGITVVSLTLQCKQKGFNRGNGGEKKTPRDLIDKRLGRQSIFNCSLETISVGRYQWQIPA